MEIVILETDEIEARASPRNPYVIRLKISSLVDIFDVACLSMESIISFFSIPDPLSEIFTSLPPLKTSIFTESAPASKEFSKSSFIIEAGFSTTSPAAIILDTLSSRIFILFI